MQAQYDPSDPQQQLQIPFGDAASMQRQMLAWQMQQLRPVRAGQLQLPYHSHDNPVAQHQDGSPPGMVILLYSCQHSIGCLNKHMGVHSGCM